MNTKITARQQATIVEWASKRSAEEAAREFKVEVSDVQKWMAEATRERMQGLDTRPGERKETEVKVQAERRRKRHSNNGFNQNLYISDELITKFDQSGFKLRWMNDTKNNLMRQYNNDWEFVTNDEIAGFTVGVGSFDKNTSTDNRVSVLVGSQETGAAIRAYLMKKNKDFYAEDQSEKLRPVREVEALIKSGKFKPSGAEDTGNTYVPRDGIKITERINNG